MASKLPWEYRDALGYDGLPVNEDLAIKLAETAGVHASNSLGDTPLSTAAMLGRVRTMRWLLDNGADVDYVAPRKNGKTPLLWACEQKRLEATTLLLDRGANIEAVDRFNDTPLAMTFVNCFADPLQLAELLIQRGAAITDRVRELGASWNEIRFQEFLTEFDKTAK